MNGRFSIAMFDYQRVDLNSSMVNFPQPVAAWPAFTSGDAASKK